MKLRTNECAVCKREKESIEGDDDRGGVCLWTKEANLGTEKMNEQGAEPTTLLDENNGKNEPFWESRVSRINLEFDASGLECMEAQGLEGNQA